jgi:hypothetical protein
LVVARYKKSLAGDVGSVSPARQQERINVMSDYVERMVFGNPDDDSASVYVELGVAGATGAQFELAGWGVEPSHVFTTQVMDAGGTYQDVFEAMNISISVSGRERTLNLIRALEWLADALRRHCENAPPLRGV